MLHMIGNAHLDPVWLWRWPEGCAEAIATGWAAVDRLDEHPGVIFTRGEAVIYRWIEDLDPPLFARIRAFVAAGHWASSTAGGSSPTATCRAASRSSARRLYGKPYFA